MSTGCQAPGGRRLPVFLCGERLRGDDAVAFALADALAPAERDALALIEVGALEVGHLLELRPGEPCIVVDAVAGPDPGALVEMPLAEVAALAGCDAFAGRASSHAMPLPDALALARILRGDSVAGSFLGVGVAGCALGAPLSAPVAAAVPALAQALARCAGRLASMESLAC